MNGQISYTSESTDIEARKIPGHLFERNQIGGEARVHFGDNNIRDQHFTLNIAPIESREVPLAPSSSVPFRRDIDFIDRGNLLAQVEAKCAGRASRVALVGLGGVGKSQLAIEYCHRLHEKSPNTWIFWVHASNAERVEQSYREIAEQIKIEGRKDPCSNIFDLVVGWLRDEAKGQWLLVLDSADDDAVLALPQTTAATETASRKISQLQRPLSAYLPQSANGTLLVTTRARTVASKLVEARDIIAVEPMVSTESVALLQKKLESVHPEIDMKELAGALEHMPLALVQAAAFIQQKGSSYCVRQYIEEFQRSDKRKASLLSYEAGHLRRDPEAKNSIIITWQISFTYIREQWPSTAELLALMSFFDRQGIPEEVLIARIDHKEQNDNSSKLNNGKKMNDTNWPDSDSEASSEDDSSQFEENIDRLGSYSFVSLGSANRTFEMHRLVQLAMQKWLAMHGEDERWRSEFCRKLNAVFPYPEFYNRRQCERLLPHVKAAERNRPASEQSIRDWAKLLRNAGLYFLAKLNDNEAEAMFDRSVRAMRKVYDDDDENLLSLMNNLTSTYCNQGRWAEAEQLATKITKTCHRIFGPEHMHTLISMENLALAYQAQQKLAEAEELQIEIVKTRQRKLGDENLSTMISLGNLAFTYWRQERYTEAEGLAVKVTKIRRRLLGNEHPDTLVSMCNLALTYLSQGRLTEAEELETEAMKTWQKILGDEHPSTLICMENLAWTYKKEGRLSEAEELEMKVLKARQKVLGNEDMSTLNSMENLAAIFEQQGRRDEAIKLMMDNLQLNKRVFGIEHYLYLKSLKFLNELQGKKS